MKSRFNTGMKKTYKYILIVAGILVLFCLGMWAWPMTSWSAYSAVAMETGDIYFGKIGYFPCLHMRDVWYLQRTGDENTPYSLGKLTDLRWSPEDKINLNYEKVVWIAKLDKAGQVATGLKNPASLQPSALQPGQSGTPTESAPKPPAGE